ncbi:MAG: type II secretion system F family protein [Anaerolineales bacterium]
MDYRYPLAIVFGTLILMVLLTLPQLDDQKARKRLQIRLLGRTKPSEASFSIQLQPLLQTIPVPHWWQDLLKPETVAWSGIQLTADQYKSVWWLSSWLGLLLGILAVVISRGKLGGCLVGSLLLLAGIALPYYVLQRRIRIRRRSIELSLPDFLDMLTFTVEAGLGLIPAITRVTNGFRGHLSDELKVALVQIDLGHSQRESLLNLARRIPSSDIEQFVEAILLAERLGTSLARTMRIQSNLLRTRRLQRAKVQAQTAAIRIIPALVFFFLPSLLLVYLAPPILNFLLRR